MALQEKKRFKLLVGKEFHWRTMYGFRNGDHRYIDTLGHDITAFKKIRVGNESGDSCVLDGLWFKNITQNKNVTTGSFGLFGFNGNINEIMDKVNEYREIFKVPYTLGIGFMSGVYGVKKPSTKEYPSLIDFNTISYVPEILSYKQAANKQQMRLSALWKHKITSFSSASLANMLHKQETMYLNPYDYKFHSIADDSIVATNAPEHYWAQINAYDEGSKVSPFKYVKERKRALANFKYYGCRLMLSKYTENKSKRDTYFANLLPNCEILSAEPFVYDETNKDMIRLILQDSMSDYYDGNDNLIFTVANKQYKLNLIDECFIDVETNQNIDCILVFKEDKTLDYLISFEEYKSKLKYLYKLDSSDESIIQKVLDYFTNKRTDKNECLKEQYITLGVRDSALSKYFCIYNYEGVIDSRDSYMYNQLGGIENYNTQKNGLINPNDSTFIPIKYEMLSYLPNRIYNINYSYSHYPFSQNNYTENFNTSIYNNPTIKHSSAKEQWNIVKSNPIWQYRKIDWYDISPGQMGDSGEHETYSTNGAISLIEDGEYSGEKIFVYKDGSTTIGTQNTDKELDRIIENQDILFNIFNIVTNLNNIDRTELDSKLVNNESISAHLYMAEIDYKLANNMTESYDTFDIQPIFVIDGLYCINDVYVQQFIRQLTKYYPTDEELESLKDDVSIDNKDRKYIIKEEASTEYEDGTSTAGKYEIATIEKVKEYVKFRLNKRVLKRYSKLRVFINELKNTTESFLVKYKDENGNIKVMLHKADYLTFKQNTEDINTKLVKCLPYVYLYNREHILLPFKASYYDPFGLFGLVNRGLLVSGLVNIFSKKAAQKIREKILQTGFGLLQRDGKLGEYDQKTHTFTANNPAYAEYYNDYNKKVNMYFRNLYSYYLREYDALANPSYQDLDYKIDNVKKRRRLAKKFWDKDNPFYVQPPFKIEEKNEDDFTAYMNSTKASLFSVCVTTRFSFMLYLNRTIRKTKLLAKMGYIYLDYFYKQYNGEYNQWITLPLYPPDRIQYSEKLCRIRFMKSKYDIELEGNKAMFYCVFSYKNDTLTFYNKAKQEKFIFDLKTYCYKYKEWYFNNKGYNELTKAEIGNLIKKNQMISYFDVRDTDIAFKVIQDTIKLSTQYPPTDKYIKYTDGYKYIVGNPFYNTSITLDYQSNNQTFHKLINFKWRNTDTEWIGFYTPHELDLNKYTFDDKLASVIRNNLINNNRNIVTYLVNIFCSKTITELKDIYKKLYNLDIDITESINDNIFDLNNLIDTFSTNTNIDTDIFQTEDNATVLVKQNQYALPTIASNINLDILAWEGNANNSITYNGTKYYGPAGMTNNYISNMPYKVNNNGSNLYIHKGNSFSNTIYYGYSTKQGGYFRKDLSSICFLESMSLYNNWNESAFIDISFNNNDKETRTKKEVALEIIGDWIINDVLPSSKIISIDEFKKYFINEIKQPLKDVFSSYEIYNIGFNNLLVSNTISSADTSPTVFIDNIYKQDFCFTKQVDFQDNIFNLANVLLPVPVDAYKRMPYYCKKFLAEYYGVMESQCLQPMVYASEEANIKRTILDVSNAIVIFVIALVIMILALIALIPSGGSSSSALPAAAALMAVAIALLCVAFIFQIVSIVIPSNRLSKIFADISKGFSIASSVFGAAASIANIAQAGLSSLTSLQIATICVNATTMTIDIINAGLQAELAKREQKKIDEYNRKVDEYNQEMDKLEKFYEDNEFNFGYLEVQPLNIDFKENTIYDKQMGLDIETVDATSSLYTMVDDYYDTIL